MTAQTKTGDRIGLGLLIAAVVVAIIAILIHAKTAVADAMKTLPIDDGKVKPPPSPDPKPDPIKIVGPDPYNPTTEPVQGRYCIPVKEDGEILLCQRAGLENISHAWRVMRDHPRNEWIPRYLRPTATEKQLYLCWGYEAMSGREDVSWAWNTDRVAGGGLKICVVYVPTQAEVGA